MHSLYAATRNELLKLIYRRKAVNYLIFSALVPIIVSFLLARLKGVIGISAVNAGFSVNILVLFTSFLLPLFIFLLAADLFPGEVSSRTLKLSLLRPVTRFKVFLAKTVAIAASVAVLLLLVGVVSAVSGVILAEHHSVASLWLDTVKSYITAFVPMVAIITSAVFITQWFRRSSSALVFLILLYTAAKSLPIFFHSAEVFSLASYTDWHTLWLGQGVSPIKLLSTALFLLSSSVLLFTAGYYIFERKEF